MRRIGISTLLAFALLFACHKTDDHAGHSAPTAEGTTAASTPPATTSAPPVAAGTVVSFASAEGQASGYLALPSGASGKKPAIIVIQEWWGVDDWIRAQTDRFAQQGYVALAVDLYRGKSTKSMEEAHELSRGLPEDRAVADLEAGVEYLSKREDVDPTRIGVIGWCLGGGYALALATNDARLKATAVNYGHLITDRNAITKIHSEILGNFGGEDRGIPAKDVDAFGATLTKYGKLSDIKIYPGAGHAFMNPNNQQGYKADAAQDAWGRIDRFFSRTLRANMPNS